jgi:hypothetical protein
MATFAISIVIEVDVDSYDEAYELENTLTQRLMAMDEVIGVGSIDVEQTDGFEDEDEE